MMPVYLNHIPVGAGEPVYIVAEIGGNHDGNIDQAVTLIRAAAHAQADAAKFQFFDGTTLYPGEWTPGSIDPDWIPELQAECATNNLDFLCSVFSRDTLDTLLDRAGSNLAAVKIASPEATNHQLLDAAALTGLPLIVSTGAMNWHDLDRTMSILYGVEVVILHCVSAYPAMPDELNLRVIPAITRRYKVPAGFSDHTLDPYAAPLAAVAAGACLIEKHLTIDSRLDGPDHGFALEPDEFRNMVDTIREGEAMLGDGVKRVQQSEDPTDRRQAA